MDKNFNVIITGFGGQGLITLVDILAAAAFFDGYDVKSSELHGLSQRGGAVSTFITFGKKVYSPLFCKGSADLILGMELLEGLRGCEFANSKTKILANDYFFPFLGITPKEEVIKKLKEIGGNNLQIINASGICKEKLDKELLSGVYLLGFACYKNLVPIKSEAFLKAIESVMPKKYREINIKAFQLAQ